MHYLGGKFRIRKQIATFLESIRKPDQPYFEPFVGGGWVLQEMSGKRFASDGCFPLIAMYKDLQNGWVPPNYMTKDEYDILRKDTDPYNGMVAFAGFGCSFAGKFFGGFIGNNESGKAHHSVMMSASSLMKQLPKIQDVEFIYGEFHVHDPNGCLIYCDPPYQGTTQYGAFSGFDHSLFWGTMRNWSMKNTVVISEYNAPDDFKCVWEQETKMCMYDKTNTQQTRIERLFMMEETA